MESVSREARGISVIANTDNPLFTQTISATGINPDQPKVTKETDRQRRRRKKKAKVKAKRFLSGIHTEE